MISAIAAKAATAEAMSTARVSRLTAVRALHFVGELTGDHRVEAGEFGTQRVEPGPRHLLVDRL